MSSSPPPHEHPSSAQLLLNPQQPKPLRFVTNYGAPHPKRRRIGAACLTCRKRKTACSGERPHCDTCAQNKLECAGYSAESATPSSRPRTNSNSTVNDDEPRRKSASTKKTAIKKEKEAPARSVPQEAPARSVPQEFELSPPQPPSPRAAPTIAEPAKEYEQPNESLFSGPRNRMPYFRWLGPTAIMPGFKQMVVKVRRQDPDMARSSSDGGMLSPPSNPRNMSDKNPSFYSTTPAAGDSDIRTPVTLPFYDTSPIPPSELITHLAGTFFTHLGCNYPFLQRDRFLMDLEEKQVDTILVDAVCALAARFSTHSLLKQQHHDENKLTPAEYGHVFAIRAKHAIVNTFACPSVAAVQAALLLAYNEFGESRDSGLWMYLGIAIRMAEDLGMHKLEGLRYKGIDGPTPRQVKRESRSGAAISKYSKKAVKAVSSNPVDDSKGDVKVIDEQKAVEQERVDTFWAVFFLDRVVSSGTGRRSTLRDKDIELSFPSLDEKDPSSGWPAPFPALIRIVHLYGRVADLLNSFKEPSDITSDTPKRLAAMETQVTQFYQGLSPRLHFDAVSFQHYMKAGEGTNFVLLHFWFHTLIVLLHQPTLLKTFEGRVLQLFPNSQQLAMSSAKTITDILSYSQLMDAKASLGNPFTTQPIYIAACAFLKETAEQTATSNAQSRASTPPSRKGDSASSTGNGTPKKASMSGSSAGKRTPTTHTGSLAKHTLLATAASQHYQLCYQALQSIETYWSGTKYILTILDQKFQGVEDPLLYTTEEGDASMERPRPEPAFTSPGWRRKLTMGQYLPPSLGEMVGMQNPFFMTKTQGPGPGSPPVDPSRAIGWTLTGTMNSPSTNLALHYPGSSTNPPQDAASMGSFAHPGDYGGANGRGNGSFAQNRASSSNVQQSRPPAPSFPAPANSASNGDAELLLGLNSPYQSGPSNTDTSHSTPGLGPNFTPDVSGFQATSINANAAGNVGDFNNPYGNQDPLDMNFSDMMIESQDVDMSMLGLDMMPWFNSYPTHEFGGMFDPTIGHNDTGDESQGGGA